MGRYARVSEPQGPPPPVVGADPPLAARNDLSHRANLQHRPLLSRHLRAEEGTTDAPRYDAVASATGDSPQTHQGLTGRVSNQFTRKGTITLVDQRLFCSRHLRTEEGTTDAPRCHSTMRSHATHHMPSGARSVPCPCFNSVNRHHQRRSIASFRSCHLCVEGKHDGRATL